MAITFQPMLLAFIAGSDHLSQNQMCKLFWISEVGKGEFIANLKVLLLYYKLNCLHKMLLNPANSES